MIAMPFESPRNDIPKLRLAVEGDLPRTEEDFAADIAIVGLGYVGLPTALAFHAAGMRVIGLDASPARIAAVQAGRVDLLPSDLDRLSVALDDPGFAVTMDPAMIANAAAVIIAVPTPVDDYLLPDLRILRSACETVTSHVRAGQLVVLTSTTYVGTTNDMIVKPLAERGFTPGQDVFVAFSPERIDPGNATHAHEDVPRVVGGVTPACTDLAVEMLAQYVGTVHRVSSPEAAEMTKLLENTFRAVNIALANEFSEASRALGLDVIEVIDAASTKPYGFTRFTPGPGVGGHCIPCDPHYLLWQLRRARVDTPLIEEAMKGIANRPIHVADRAREVLSDTGKPLLGSRILVLGVAYKPNVEDVRESPALEIIERLVEGGAEVDYHDRFVPAIRLPGGEALQHVCDPEIGAYDLVVVHTRHLGMDTTLLSAAPMVLDATYSLPLAANVVRV
jgi:nucleotide sugar dehydrogenase